MTDRQIFIEQATKDGWDEWQTDASWAATVRQSLTTIEQMQRKPLSGREKILYVVYHRYGWYKRQQQQEVRA